MDDSDDILVENVVVNAKATSSSSNNIELVELGSSSDEEENPTFSSDAPASQPCRVFRPILPWCDRSSAFFQQRFQERQQRKRRNSNEYEITEVSSEGRLLVNVGKPPSDPDVYVIDHLTNVLQPHQLQGVKFMYDNIIGSIESYKNSEGEGCILAHSMGLGKTLQIITFVEIFFRFTGFKRVIIVCPVNTIQNWANEFEKWLPIKDKDGKVIRTFNVHLLNDAVKGGLSGRTAFVDNWFHTGGVLLISYDMFKLLTGSSDRRNKKKANGDIATNGEDEASKEVQAQAEIQLRKQLREALVYPGADMIVCDEGHQIKNMKTEKSASLNAVFTKRRVVLTGYPLQNNLWEYYCMVSFVRPGHLGTKKNFREMFEKPINAALGIDAKPAAIRLCKMRTHVLQTKLAGFVQRRTQHLLKKILPDSKEYVVLVRKSPIQQKLYRAFVDETNSDIFDQNSSFNPLRAHTICVKVLNHPDMLYAACEERKKRELAKVSRKGDSENSTSAPAPSGSATTVTISENPSDMSRDFKESTANATENSSGFQMQSSCGENYASRNWSYNTFQNVNNANYSNAPNYSNFNSTNFSDFLQQSNQQASMLSNNLNENFHQNNNDFSTNYWPNMNMAQYASFGNHTQNFSSTNFNAPSQFSYNYFNSQNNLYNNSNMMNSYNGTNMFSNSTHFPPQCSLMDSFNFDYSNDNQQQRQQQYNQTQQSYYEKEQNSEEQSNYSANNQKEDVKPAINLYNQTAENFSGHNQTDMTNRSTFSNNNTESQSWRNATEQQTQFYNESNEIKYNAEQNYSRQNNNANHNITDNQSYQNLLATNSANISKPVTGGRFSAALKFADSANGVIFSNDNVESQSWRYNGLSAKTAGFIHGVNWNVSDNSNKSTASADTISLSTDSSKICTDDQRPSTSADAATTDIRVKNRVNKGKRMTLGDALLEDDEHIDNSIKLEWTKLPLRDYKPGIVENSSKMEVAFSIIDETTRRGEKILFFSSSVNTLNTFESFLCSRFVCTPKGAPMKWRKNINFCRFDGRTTGVERERLINRFNSEPELLLFLISTKAGSLGINLVSASRVIIFEASWNPCDDAQAICRIYRYGQRKQTFIYRLIMNNSMEKAIFHRQIAKSSLQQKVVDHQDIDAKVSTKELETLFLYDEKADFKPIEKELDAWDLEDDLLMEVARKKVHLFADVPFLHESLMLESEEKLSEEEKYEAELLYEREMRGGYLNGYSWGDEFGGCSSRHAIGESSPAWSGAQHSGANSAAEVLGPPRLFPPDFAFNHPGAAAFNRAYRRAQLGEESMMMPPHPAQVSTTDALVNQILENPTPYPKLLKSTENSSSYDTVDDTIIDNTPPDIKNSDENRKQITLSEALNSLISNEEPSSTSSSSSSVIPLLPQNPAVSFSSYNSIMSVSPNKLSSSTAEPPIRRPIQQFTVNSVRPYAVASDGRVVISKDIKLPSIRTNGGIVELKAGEMVVMCRTVNGTYLKTSNGDLLDASDTIYNTPQTTVRRRVNEPPPSVEKRRRFEPNEVIELE